MLLLEELHEREVVMKVMQQQQRIVVKNEEEEVQAQTLTSLGLEQEAEGLWKQVTLVRLQM